MRLIKPVWIPLAIATTGFAVLWWWQARPAEQPETASRDTAAARPAETPAAPAARDALTASFERLKSSPDSQQSLKQLQEKLRSLGSAEAVAWIRDFLASGKDKPTGLTFEIGADHTLKQWPTFRTFLLDALHAIDPAAAAEISREILAKPTTADEWSLALRNIGLADDSPEASAEMIRKTEALITNPAWQAEPSIGYLNAFDVLVHTQAVQSTGLLSELIQRKDRKDLVHAAFLTLDRLAQSQPEEVLTRLAADHALQQNRPEMTAQQFARADLRDPAQQAIVKFWLLDSKRSANELNSFSGIYPNNNHFVSNNLLTTESARTGSDLAAHDRAALEIINSWSTDPTFAPVKEHLLTMIRRLNGFVATPNDQTP